MQKTLFSFLSLSLFLSFCIAEENGAYASVGFEYSISHAIQHNNPFLNQERIQIISNAQNKIYKINQVKNEITSMPNTFACLKKSLQKSLTPTKKPLKLAKNML